MSKGYNEDKLVLGYGLRGVLADMGISKAEAARRSGVDHSLVVRLTGFEPVGVKASTVRKLARGLGVSADELLCLPVLPRTGEPDDGDDRGAFGRGVVRRLDFLGATPGDFCRASGIGADVVHRWRHGGDATVANVRKASLVLAASADDLLGL
jgi:transcriptional regulator with XRE-family HTH domain